MAADVVLDIMAGSYLDPNVRSLATGGRLVVIRPQGGLSAELDLGQLFRRRASITSTSLRARNAEEKSAIVADTVSEVWLQISAGKVRPVVHPEFPLERVDEAHRVLEKSSHIGKLGLVTGA